MLKDAERTNLGIEPAVLLDIYRQMSRIHEVDKAIRSGLSAGRFQFTYWPMTGQEAIPATLATLTDANDYMVTIYRGIHDQVAKGVPLKGLFAEAMSRQDGLNKGKGGSPHISDPTSGSMLTTAIVGAGAPIANGLALAAKMRGEGRVTVVNFGDGATSIGAVHEAMNLAGAWKLPIIFMCQNNQIGEYTKIPEYTAGPDFAGRATALGFRGVKVDANDPIAFHAVMKEIVEDVRAGKGPAFVEAVTLRLGTHAGFAPNELLTKDELAAGRENWPVPKTRAFLLEAGLATEAELAEIDGAAKTEVDEAVAFALASAPITEEDMLTDVYGDETVVPRRGVYPVREEEAPVSGETKMMAMYEAIISVQDLAMEADEGVFLLGEDIGDPPGGVFKTTAGLQTKWGKERVRPTPIAEQAIIGAATGAALVGMRPVAEIMFSDFMGVCIDQITNHAAKQRYMSGSATNVPMTIRVLVAGGLGGFGAQHSQSLEAWLLHVPGLKIAYPSTTLDARGLLASCIFDEDPCVHFESMAMVFGAPKQAVPIGDYRIPLGVAKVRREGSDITLVSFGWQVNQCLAAAEELAKEGINAEVIDLRSLMPLDYHRVLDSVKKTRRALVVHAATEFCGLGSEIASTINEELFSILKAPASRFGAYYSPISFSPAIEAAQMPNKGSIIARVREVMKDRD
ncbi:alpha-ketoacid dehydrogenase subunit alpha/beta [Sphingomonas solaris]|uniref:2-oxoglutarate dehydrogenase E1 component n=1 Tax=Alterirhizorhabdus solaris TaxID=2529389 RepID=A0A558R1R9_9SPHN|nr:alpha-ketoacid dehydrogenase subunit alpha/beta [Sphingomonas solaris]TVV73336.1 dehydrogenase [Sphingomonas solaris]